MHVQATTAASDGSLPVPLHGLGNWAAVVGKMCQSAAGQSGHDKANFCLSEYFNHTNDRLDSMVRIGFLKLCAFTALPGVDFGGSGVFMQLTFYKASSSPAVQYCLSLQVA